MKTSYWILIAIAAVFFIGGCSTIVTYNGMVSAEEGVDAQWANVENVYQRRADLIPNLVNTVKGYASHESGTLTAVVEARAKATQTTVDVGNMTAEDLAAFQSAQDGLSGALSKLMMITEAYPDLKAQENFSQLMVELEKTENRIAVERRKFNNTAKDYNKLIRKFPNSMFAGMFGFDKKPYFQSAAGADVAPEVTF